MSQTEDHIVVLIAASPLIPFVEVVSTLEEVVRTLVSTSPGTEVESTEEGSFPLSSLLPCSSPSLFHFCVSSFLTVHHRWQTTEPGGRDYCALKIVLHQGSRTLLFQNGNAEKFGGLPPELMRRILDFLWQVRLQSSLETGHSSAINHTCFSPSGKIILSCSGGDQPLKMWDAESGLEKEQKLTGHKSWVNCCCFSPCGLQILSCSHDKTLRLWDATSGTLLQTLEGHTDNVWSCCFSSDGAYLLSASGDSSLKKWNAKNGVKLLNTLTGHTQSVNAGCFSPNGDIIMSGSDDETCRLWDALTGKVVLILRGHMRAVQSCCFSASGDMLLSCSRDKTLRIWSSTTGVCMKTLRGHMDVVKSCQFSVDGHQILSGSYDATLKV